MKGAQSWCSPANGTSCSEGEPPTSTTRIPDARDRASASTALLPIPGSPVTSSTPLPPTRAAASSRSTTCCSCSRPTSTGAV